MQLMKFQFYINRISRCLGIVDLISERRNIISETLSSSVIHFLQVDYIQTIIISNKTLVFIRNLEAHQLYSLLCIPIQTNDQDTVRTFPHIQIPPLILLPDLTQFRQKSRQWFDNLKNTTRTKMNNLTNNFKNWLISDWRKFSCQMIPRWSKKKQTGLYQKLLNKIITFIHLPHPLKNALRILVSAT